MLFVVCYESIKRELKIKSIYECRCDERLQTKTREVTRLAYVEGDCIFFIFMLAQVILSIFPFFNMEGVAFISYCAMS